MQVPPAVYNFLSWLLCGDKSEAPLCLESRAPPANQAMHRRILSLGQDLIFNATRGHIKTAKHVALPIALKHLNGSTQAVTILNRFGHCMSETQLREYETGMAQQQLELQYQGNAFLPSNIHAGGYVSLCWDNNDLLEETKTGTGTTHCTNGIVVQRLVTPVVSSAPCSQNVASNSASQRQHQHATHTCGRKCFPGWS